jgi:hypothetical protein
LNKRSYFVLIIFLKINLSYIPNNKTFILENDFIERACKIYTEIGKIDDFYSYKEIIPQKMLEKAKLKFLSDQDLNSVLFFYNAGIIFKGSVGLAITKNGFYWRTDSGLPQEVRFNNIKAINMDGYTLKIVKKNDETVSLSYSQNRMKYFILKVFYHL